MNDSLALRLTILLGDFRAILGPFSTASWAVGWLYSKSVPYRISPPSREKNVQVSHLQSKGLLGS